MAEPFGELGGNIDDRPDVDSGLDARTVEHVDQVLGRDIAGRRRGEGAATNAADAGVERTDPGLDCRLGVGEPRVSRVVKVAAQRNAGRCFVDRRHALMDLRRHTHTDGIGEGDLAGLGDGGYLRYLGDALGRDFSFIWAAEGGTDGDAARRSCIAGQCRDLVPGGECFFDAGALVAPVEGLAGDDDEVDLMATRLEGALDAAAVERETDVGNAVAPRPDPPSPPPHPPSEVRAWG